MKYIYKHASAAFFLIYGIGAAYLFIYDRSALSLYFAVPFCTLSTNLIIRKIVGRKRPPNSGKSSNSFPSNHSASSCIIAIACFSINIWFGAVVGLMAIFTGISRIQAKVHYVSDVLAGFGLSLIFGTAWMCLLS